MNLRFTISAAALALSAMFLLSAVASAQEPDVTHHSMTDCGSGEFFIDLDFVAGPDGGDVELQIEGNEFAVVPPPAGMTATGTDDPDWAPIATPDEWDFDNFEDREDFFTLSGDYDSVNALADQAVTVEYRVELNGSESVTDSDSVTISSGPDGDQNPDNDWEKCIVSYCSQGGSQSDYSFQATSENNCDFINVCVGGPNGDVERMTEFDAEQSGLEEGECDREDPPEDPEDPQGPEPTVEPEPTAVAEVSPAVDEVVALPAAGYGSTSGNSHAWLLVLSMALVGIGGTATAIAVRRK